MRVLRANPKKMRKYMSYLVVACSLNPESRSRVLADQAQEEKPIAPLRWRFGLHTAGGNICR